MHALITAVKKEGKAAFPTFMTYPFSVAALAAPIKSQEEFEARYDEIFDEDLINLIKYSDLYKDWSSPLNGELWLFNGVIRLTKKGKFVSTTHQTLAATLDAAKAQKKEKEKLHPSIQKMDYPVLAFKTDNFIVRIDSVGGNRLRYTSWSSTKTMKDKPDLILYDGINKSNSTTGEFYTFSNGRYFYDCLESARLDGNQFPFTGLIIRKDDTVLGKEVGTLQ